MPPLTETDSPPPTAPPVANIRPSSDGMDSPGHSRRLIGFALFVGCLTAAYTLPLIEIVQIALKSRTYNHILLIPFISGYLIWQERALPARWKTSGAPGFLLLLLGSICLGVSIFQHWPADSDDRSSLLLLSFLSFLISGGFLFFGRETIQSLAFPVGYLLFAVPMPVALMHWIEIQLQYASAEAAYWMLTLLGAPFLRMGEVDFQLPGIPIKVAEECSGFNSTFVLFIVSLLAGHLFLKSPWKKAILVFAVIPLAVIRNGLRITTIAMLCIHYGPHMINSPIHKHGGPPFFALSLIPFLALLWFLRRAEKHKSRINPINP